MSRIKYKSPRYVKKQKESGTEVLRRKIQWKHAEMVWMVELSNRDLNMPMTAMSKGRVERWK